MVKKLKSRVMKQNRNLFSVAVHANKMLPSVDDCHNDFSNAACSSSSCVIFRLSKFYDIFFQPIIADIQTEIRNE